MNTRLPTFCCRLFLMVLLVSVIKPPTNLQAQSCGAQSPARYVPEELWIRDPVTEEIIFRPGLTQLPDRQLPPERDSTSWDSIGTPGFHSGEELFESLDIAGNFLFVAYNAGFSIWDIVDPENPERIEVRDGWNLHPCPADPSCGTFLSFPGTGEVDHLVEGIDVIPANGPFIYIAVSGKNPVGISLWRFNSNSRELEAIYQDTTRVSRQVRWIPVDDEAGTTYYALSSYGNGIAVYDMTQALGIGPCLQESGADCPGVDRGDLGTIATGRYLDVLKRDSGEILVAASDGDLSSFGLQIWQVSDLSNPGSAIRLFNGLHARTFGNALFNYEGNDYLATLERDGDLNVIKIFNINACGPAPCTLGPPVFDGVGVPPRISDQFLTFSKTNGKPFLYYGLQGGLAGPKIEQLLNLTTLGRPDQNITEMTDGGPTLFDPCSEQDLTYWSWYYPGNGPGLKNLNPRVGKFHPETGYFYRAAHGLLDVHVWERAEDPPQTTATVSSPDPQGLYWMTDDITFEGGGSDGCNPTGIWNWSAETPAEIDAVLVSEVDNQVTYRFECTAAARCDNAVVSVSGTNSDPSCAGAEPVSVFLTVKDPTVDITAIEPSSGTFSQCNDVEFMAALVGRGPVEVNWSARRETAQDPHQTFEDTVTDEDLQKANSAFVWNTAAATFAGIFADGFESGDLSAWSQPPPVVETFVIESELGVGGPSRSVTVELSSCTP